MSLNTFGRYVILMRLFGETDHDRSRCVMGGLYGRCWFMPVAIHLTVVFLLMKMIMPLPR